jgi:predicted Zn-dependent peptidase
MAEALARWIALGGNATSLDLYRQAILQVPTAYVQKIARNLLSQNRRNVVALLPQAPKSIP